MTAKAVYEYNANTINEQLEKVGGRHGRAPCFWGLTINSSAWMKLCEACAVNRHSAGTVRFKNDDLA